MELFKDIIIKNNCIKTFHLMENGFGKEILKETFMSSNCVKSLYLSGNDLDVEAENDLRNFLSEINLIFDYNI